MSHATAERVPAEAAIRAWETDAAPGFLHSLMRIVQEHSAIDEPTRLLAVVVAKNTVGGNWRKTLGTREWSRVPEEEKGSVRNAVLQLMLSDPSDRVALQLGLLASNICAFDFPSRWPDVLSHLLAAADWASPFAPQFKLRALRALKHIFKGLLTKRFVAEPLTQQPGASAAALGMASITSRLQAERQLYKEKLKECAAPLQQLVAAHLPAFLNPSSSSATAAADAAAAAAAGGGAAGGGWQIHGLFAKAAVNGTTELLPLIADPAGLPEGTRQLLELLHGAANQLMAGVPAGAPLPPAELNAWRDLAGRLHERVCKCIIAHLDSHPLPFAEYVPYFLKLFVDAALLQLDAATLRAMRPKRRVLLVRFLAKALLCPYYRPEYVEAQAFEPMGGSLIEALHSKAGVAVAPELLARLQQQRQQQQQQDGGRAQGRVAAEALQQLLSKEQVSAVVEALVLKYVALTHEELEEWSSDPEGYIRSIEVESGPDADTPRPVGVGLLLCMLERGGEEVAQALINLTARLQAAGEGSPDMVLMREACYRCIGEGYSHVSNIVPFSQWYASELSGLLRSRLPAFLGTAGEGSPDIIAAVLQARALWLVGACGTELEREQWVDAWGLSVAHIGARDLVVALQAVQAVLLLAIQILDDQAILDQVAAAKLAASKKKGTGAAQLPGLTVGNAAAVDAALSAAEGVQDDEAVTAARERLEWRLAVLTGNLEQLLAHVFGLLGRLSEVESSVRLLQLVSVVAEAAGERLQPHLGALAAALPGVWQASTKQASGGNADTGALARLHSALMAVITHLVGKLRHAAMANEQVQAVMYPLLGYATNLHNPEAEVLVEEALKCWGVALAVEPAVAPQLVGLLGNMSHLLKRGTDNSAAFQILEAYLLLQAGQALQPYSEVISAALTAAIRQVSKAVLDSCGLNTAAAAAAHQQQQQQQQQQGLPGAPARPGALLASEVTQEGLAAAALVDVMLQLYPADVPQLLLPCFQAMAQLVGNEALPLPRQGLPVKVLNVLEGFLEVLARLFLGAPSALPALLAPTPEQQQPAAAAADDGSGSSSSSAGVSLHRFVDCWLLIASATFLEELLGVGHMAMLGRFRRRIAAAALSRLISEGVLPASVLLEQPARLARLAGVMVKVCDEVDKFAGDIAHLDGLHFEQELNSDFVLAARLNLSKGDAVRHLDVFATFQAAMAALAAAAGGEAGLMALLQAGAGNSPSPAMQELQPLVSSLLHGTLAAQLEAQKAAAEQQRQQRLAAAAAAAAADGDVDWGSGGEEAMM
ncbi:hypothetical protein OEZ85_013510 [Tetradesmus obliquus]|uniref:Importin N-terminal domain-containing protein n=1 Tax=Tetradesmus obliquus TaxID=3088 RepID=A0ABY8UU39_TETOB|nr:hypothetical protein OEZ85_013510 [Tetradesmus obliquus]